MFCPSCGAEVGVGRRFCGKCGSAIRASVGQGVGATTTAGRDRDETKPLATTQRSSRGSRAVYAVVALLAILGGAAWWWFHRPPAAYVVEDPGIYPFETLGADGKTPKFGFIDSAGKVLIQPEWDTVEFGYVHHQTVVFSEGLCAVRKDGKWGYINTSGQLAIPNQFEMAFPFIEGLAQVKLGNQIGYIDKTGSYSINPQFDQAGNFQEGLAAAHTDGGWGFIDKAGIFAIKPTMGQTISIYGFSQGLAPACVSKCGYIDRSGRFAISPQFRSASNFSDGMALVRINTDKWGYINTDGKIVINPQFDSAEDFIGGLAVVSVSGNQGVINKQGKYVVNPGQFHILLSGGDLQQVSSADGIGLITREGKWVLRPSKAVTEVGALGKLFFGKIGGQFVPISISGKVLTGWYKGEGLDSLAQDIENESSAIQSMRTLTRAEASYAAAHPANGFTFSIPALGPTTGSPDENHAGFIEADLATGTKDGYLFTTRVPDLTQSRGANYFIVAKPAAGHGGRTFCADSSGAVHYAVEGEECAASDAFPIAAYGQASVAADRTAQTGIATEAIPNTSGARQNPARSGPDSSRSTAEAEQWVSRAENQFQQADYRSAIQSCDAALRVEPGNAKAAQLKAKIEETMKILGKN